MVPVRNHPERSLDGLEQARLADTLLADDDQLDGRVGHRVLLQRAQVLAYVGGAFREVGRNVDERVSGERDATQSTEGGDGDGKLRQFVVVHSEVFE